MYFIEWRSFSFLFPSTTLLKRKISILLLIVLLFVGGGYFAVAAFKIEIKAKLAQILLQHAWHKTIKTGESQIPWKSFDGTPIVTATNKSTSTNVSLSVTAVSSTQVTIGASNSSFTGTAELHIIYVPS